MNKREILTNFLSILDRLEDFYKIANKKLNANKLSKKIESLVGKRFEVLKLFSSTRYKKKLKLLFNKKLDFPNYLTADGFLKGIRLFIKNKYGLTSKVKKNAKNKERLNTSTLKNKLYFSSKDLNINLIRIAKNKINSIKHDLRDDFIKQFNAPLNYIKNIKINIPIRNKRIKIDKESYTIGVAIYSDHLLTLARVILNKDNQVIVKSVIEVPIPGDVIGDKFVENKNELSNIFLDLSGLLKLDEYPLLVILSSSFFNVHTFYSSELKQISNTDNTVQSKSPYLPNETFIEFLKLSKKSEEDQLIRTIYCNRKLIESWTDTLESMNCPIIGIVPSAPNIFDILKTKVRDETTVLIDIEITKTIVMLGRNSYDLSSHIIPYGSSLYTTADDSDLSNNYFQRILVSIELITSEYQERLPSYIYVYGKGLDNLLAKNIPLPSRFKRLSDMKLVDYSYAPKSMDFYESESNSIESTIETLSLLTSCL
tara:strand:- start:5337 stop:6785 length:1449 start_codon:yes stop_codon:yes gene_type:complete